LLNYIVSKAIFVVDAEKKELNRRRETNNELCFFMIYLSGFSHHIKNLPLYMMLPNITQFCCRSETFTPQKNIESR
jgi:hypothetical protein